MKPLRRGKVSILVVPEKEGAVFSFKLPVLAFRVVVIGAVLAIIFTLIMALSWVRMARKAGIYDRLAQENETLLQEHDRIAQLQNRVEQLQQLEGQIRRVLGAHAFPDSVRRNPSSPTEDAARSQDSFDRDAAFPGRQPAADVNRPIAYAAQTAGLLHEPEIPSLWPLRGYLSRGFEADAVLSDRSHWGLDLAAQEGTVVKATAGGVVVWTGWSNLYGNVVILAHASGYISFYGHNQINLVKSRERVERGDPIALLGNTGQSSAPHLHFEIWHEDQPLDPLNVLMPY